MAKKTKNSSASDFNPELYLEKSFCSKTRIFLKSFSFNSQPHRNVFLFWFQFCVLVFLIPILLVTKPKLLNSLFVVDSTFQPFLILITLSFGIIFIGTLLYLSDIFESAFKSKGNQRKVFLSYKKAFYLLLVCLLLCGYSIYDVSREGDLSEIVKDTEYFSALLFALFSIVDYLTLRATKSLIQYYISQSDKSSLIESIEEKKFMQNQLCFIDIPVLLGITFIWVYTHFTDDYFFTIVYSKDIYRNYLATGGIAMHIIFSQFIFAILNTRKKYDAILRNQANN
jgi:hypothetical protein